jgi:signal transduction histidine kinase
MLLAAELAQRSNGSRPPSPLLDILISGTSRAAAMARRMHTLAGAGQVDQSEVDLRVLLDDVAAAVGRAFRSRVTIRIRAARTLPLLTGDRERLRQALLNICENACEAMAGGGTLSLQARVVTKGEAGITGRGKDDRRFVRISVMDTGSGMVPELANRAFDPFFTTKAPGKATGLGLPTAYSIVRSHGGQMDFDSTPGKGTRVHVYLPLNPGEGKAKEGRRGRA